MPRPQPRLLPPEDAPEFARAVLAAAHFPMLATVDGDRPRLRPMCPVMTEGFTVYLSNLRRHRKTVEIERNPCVELCYMDEEHNQVRISGRAEVVTDRAVLQRIWDGNALFRDCSGRLDNPELMIYRLRPERVRVMQNWALEYIDVPVPSREG